MDIKRLYFVAIVPPVELRAVLEEMKVAFSRKYSARHALKSPPHVTLVPPFRADESAIVPKLEQAAVKATDFTLNLENYGAFKPRVIYVDVQQSSALSNLRDTLVSELDFDIDNRPFRPHLTLATRDLTKAMFHKAWQELEHQSFQASFAADRFYLLKHNGKSWDLYRDFSLQPKGSPE